MRDLIVFFSVALLAGAVTAHAGEPDTSKLTPKAAAAVKKAGELATVSAPAGSGLKVAKDRDTGELRAPTREEDATLARNDTVRRTTQVRVNDDGSVTAYLGDEHLSDVVAVKNPDGTVSTACAPHDHSAKILEGETKIQTPATKTSRHPETE